jgi:hypothetical protein
VSRLPVATQAHSAVQLSRARRLVAAASLIRADMTALRLRLASLPPRARPPIALPVAPDWPARLRS